MNVSTEFKTSIIPQNMDAGLQCFLWCGGTCCKPTGQHCRAMKTMGHFQRNERGKKECGMV